MKPTKQTVYLPVNGEPPLVVCYDNSDWYDSITGVIEKKGYFFTSEQLNEYTQSVIKQVLETAANKAKLGYNKILVDDPKEGDDAYMNFPKVDKQSITNTFEELKKFDYEKANFYSRRQSF